MKSKNKIKLRIKELKKSLDKLQGINYRYSRIKLRIKIEELEWVLKESK